MHNHAPRIADIRIAHTRVKFAVLERIHVWKVRLVERIGSVLR
jgi:hypothetical protein